MLSLLLDFHNETHITSWEHSASVHVHTLYLNNRLRLLASLPFSPLCRAKMAALAAEAAAAAHAAAMGGVVQ